MMQDTTDTRLPVLLTTPQVAKFLRVDRSTITRWRSNGTGPKVTWLCAHVPRYDLDDVVGWLNEAVGDQPTSGSANGLPALMTINEVATLLRVHRNTLGRWRRSGFGPPVLHHSGQAPRYRRDQVLTWMTRHEGLTPASLAWPEVRH